MKTDKRYKSGIDLLLYWLSKCKKLMEKTLQQIKLKSACGRYIVTSMKNWGNSHSIFKNYYTIQRRSGSCHWQISKIPSYIFVVSLLSSLLTWTIIPAYILLEWHLFIKSNNRLAPDPALAKPNKTILWKSIGSTEFGIKSTRHFVIIYGNPKTCMSFLISLALAPQANEKCHLFSRGPETPEWLPDRIPKWHHWASRAACLRSR